MRLFPNCVNDFAALKNLYQPYGGHSANSEPSEFEVSFFVRDINYVYAMRFNAECILKETLKKSVNHSRPVNVFVCEEGELKVCNFQSPRSTASRTSRASASTSSDVDVKKNRTLFKEWRKLYLGGVLWVFGVNIRWN